MYLLACFSTMQIISTLNNGSTKKANSSVPSLPNVNSNSNNNNNSSRPFSVDNNQRAANDNSFSLNSTITSIDNNSVNKSNKSKTFLNEKGQVK